jgi:hypothetical protein
VIFQNWHAACNHYGIRGSTAAPIQEKETTMTKTSTFGRRIAAAATAFALSFVLIGATVTTPSVAYARTVYVGVVA